MAAKDPRERLANAADAAVRKGIKTLEGAVDMEKWQACPKCGTHVFFKDIRAITEALKFFMDYGFGKPATQKAPVEEPKTQNKKLSDLSDEELLALIEGETDGKAHSGAA